MLSDYRPAPKKAAAAPVAVRRPTLPPASLLAAAQAEDAAPTDAEDAAPPSHFAELDAAPEPPAATPMDCDAAADDTAAAAAPPAAAAEAAAPAGQMFAADTAKKAEFGAAQGWRAAMEAGPAADESEPSELPEPSDAAEAPAGSDTVDLFFLDAHYEPAHVGTVYLVGKVRRGADHVSACVAVSNIKQVLFVVPKPFVFQDADGVLAQCAPLPQPYPFVVTPSRGGAGWRPTRRPTRHRRSF